MTLEEIQTRLIELYQQMYEHTEPACGQCRAPRSCCDPMVCEFTAGSAKERWGVDLPATGHPKYPLMANDGSGKCTAAPHLRPMCTLHNCDICSLGFHKTDQEWTKRYYEIREEIDLLEWEVFGKVFTG